MRALGADIPLITDVTDVSDFRLARARDLGLRTAQAGTPLEEEFDVLLGMLRRARRFHQLDASARPALRGQLELRLTVPEPDVWTSLLTAMTVIRQSG